MNSTQKVRLTNNQKIDLKVQLYSSILGAIACLGFFIHFAVASIQQIGWTEQSDRITNVQQKLGANKARDARLTVLHNDKEVTIPLLIGCDTTDGCKFFKGDQVGYFLSPDNQKAKTTGDYVATFMLLFSYSLLGGALTFALFRFNHLLKRQNIQKASKSKTS